MLRLIVLCFVILYKLSTRKQNQPPQKPKPPPPQKDQPPPKPTPHLSPPTRTHSNPAAAPRFKQQNERKSKTKGDGSSKSDEYYWRQNTRYSAYDYWESESESDVSDNPDDPDNDEYLFRR